MLKHSLRTILGWTSLPALALFILFMAINVAMSPGLLNWYFIEGFIASNTPIICVTIGVAVVLISGGMDISLGSIVSLTNAFVVVMAERQINFVIILVLALLVSLAAGALNGLVVGFFRITPLLATFATSSVYAGIALWILPTPGGMVPYEYMEWYGEYFLGLPMTVYFILVPLIVWLLFRASPRGTEYYAAGFNSRKAYASGAPVSWFQFAAYSFAGLSSGIGALALTGYIGSGDPLVGAAMSMNSIAAAVIGGISLSGGKGDVWGSIFGAMFLGLAITMVVSARVSSFTQGLLTGIILLLGILGSLLLGKYRDAKVAEWR